MNSTPLVFLPGLFCDARLYSAQMDFFSLEKNERAIQVIDFGEVDTIAAMAEVVLEQAPEKCALVGLSMGGIVALEVARVADSRITGIALLDSTAWPNNAKQIAQRQFFIDRILTHGRQGLQQFIDEVVPRYCVATSESEAIERVLSDMAMSMPIEQCIGQLRALNSRQNLSEILGELSIPGLIVCGEEDILCPPKVHQKMSALMDQHSVQLCIIPHCGHIPTLEHPDKVNQLLMQWLMRVDAKSI